MGRPISPDSITNRRVVAALERLGPMDARQIAAAIHCSPNTLISGRWYLTQLHELQRIHVAGWRRADELDRSGRPLPIYAAGQGEDVPRPKPMTEAKRAKRYRKTAKYDAYVQRKRARTHGVRVIDPMLAALMGA